MADGVPTGQSVIGGEFFAGGFGFSPGEMRGIEGNGDRFGAGKGSSDLGEVLIKLDESVEPGDRDVRSSQQVSLTRARAKDQVGWARSPQEGKGRGAAGMSQRPLTLDDDPVGFGVLDDLTLNRPAGKIDSDRIERNSGPGDGHPDLTGGDEGCIQPRVEEGLLNLKSRRHLADGHIGPDKEESFGGHLRSGSRPVWQIFGLGADVPNPLADLETLVPRTEAAVESVDDAESQANGAVDDRQPSFGQGPAEGRNSDHEDVGSQGDGFFEGGDNRAVRTWNAGHRSGVLARKGPVHHGDDGVGRIAEDTKSHFSAGIVEGSLHVDRDLVTRL